FQASARWSSCRQSAQALNAPQQDPLPIAEQRAKRSEPLAGPVSSQALDATGLEAQPPAARLTLVLAAAEPLLCQGGEVLRPALVTLPVEHLEVGPGVEPGVVAVVE